MPPWQPPLTFPRAFRSLSWNKLEAERGQTGYMAVVDEQHLAKPRRGLKVKRQPAAK